MKINPELKSIIKTIISHEEFQRRKTYFHHGKETVYEHSIKVAIKAYKIAKIFKLDVNSVVTGALLHDFYTSPWTDGNGTKLHGFTHAKDAYTNAKKYFPELMNSKVKDIIIKHMWPLNPTPPKYIESWVVSISDKLISMSIFYNVSELPTYIGIKKKVEKNV